MPYIDPGRRKAINVFLSETMGNVIGPGELNYLISHAVHWYVMRAPMSYSMLNEALGVLEAAKLELYRTVIAPFEDQKRAENGSVTHLDRT
jgi:hypothetical protein